MSLSLVHFSKVERPLWQEIWRNNFTNWLELAKILELSKENQEKIYLSSRFALNVPRRLALLMEKNNIDCPIFKQFVPLKEEGQSIEGFIEDPLSEKDYACSKKLLWKYPGRALLIVSSACAMHCRYCFRQNFPYEKEKKNFTEELRIIREESSIQEVILSGGDPLSLNDQRLWSLLEELQSIPHLKRLRIHTRFPVGIPERIDDSFLSLVEKLTLPLKFVIHINHIRELTCELVLRLKKLQALGVLVLSQTVLLKGVNDKTALLEELFLTLADHSIVPYYLHQMDRVTQGAHFEVPLHEGKRLVKELQERLPGYAIPRYVQEVPGKLSKQTL